MNYEYEQERLRRLWEEVEVDEEHNEYQLASEIDLFTEERNTDSESEQDCDEDDIGNVAPPDKVPRVSTFIGESGTTR
ncbi:hypothetical protein JTB14_030775 [Gonioctena quinquepunctata]|nr:hypothetical protein JTB14_030775 [Gonioctena quinquepunctata]